MSRNATRPRPMRQEILAALPNNHTGRWQDQRWRLIADVGQLPAAN
jgi:hypothetical protein